MRSGSENSKLLPAIPRSTFAGGEGGACREFQQAEYPFKWRKHMCLRCRRLRADHRTSSGKATATAAAEGTVDIKEEEERHLPPRKRLILRFLRFQLATLAASGSKEKEEELEEGEIRSPAKGKKRRPRRTRWDE